MLRLKKRKEKKKERENSRHRRRSESYRLTFVETGREMEGCSGGRKPHAEAFFFSFTLFRQAVLLGKAT